MFNCFNLNCRDYVSVEAKIVKWIEQKSKHVLRKNSSLDLANA